MSEKEQCNEACRQQRVFYCREKKRKKKPEKLLLQTFFFVFSIHTGKLYFEMLVNVPTYSTHSYYQDFILHDFFFRVVKKQEKAKKFSVIELRSPGLGVDISMHVIAACDRYLMRR